MKIDIAYGRQGLSVDIPAGADVTVIRKRALPISDDPNALVTGALEGPVGSPTIEAAAKGARSACILICDITRPVPNRLFLRPLIERLVGAGVPLEGITVLVATGLHRPNLGDELAELVGDRWVLEHVNVVNHDAMCEDDHVQLGFTRQRHTPVGMDRRFVQADVKIATGLVEPHFMAGYSGGRKVIAPGVAHHETIRTFHSARFMEDPYATSCNLDQNPLHQEQLEILGMLEGPILAFNTVLDEHRKLAYASFGDVIASHLAAVDFVHDSIAIKLDRRFTTVVTSAAGYPLDKTYYQTVKGMVTPIDILEPGATLLVASDCSEGLGSDAFRRAQRRLVDLGPEAFLETLTCKSLADVDEWQTEMQLKPMRVANIGLFTEGLSSQERDLTGVDMVDDLNQAIADSVRAHGDDALAIIPEGPYVVPFYEAPA